MGVCFGPVHPAAHGVLGISISILQEKVISLNLILGMLSRATEKLAEQKSPARVLNYFERLDYVSIGSMEIAFSGCAENLLGVLVTSHDFAQRASVREISRILNAYLAVPCFLLDLGTALPLLISFDVRDILLFLFEFLAGSRLHFSGVFIKRKNK